MVSADEESQLKQCNIQVAAASRTEAPDLAREMLKLLKIPVQPETGKTVPQLAKAIEFFDHLQIFAGSKIAHFKRLQEATSIDYEEMLFFDDESRNREVEQLGVIMWLVRDGVTNDEIDKGVLSWRKRNRRQLE
jgi:magnesium-dependent phosphatase 1